MVIPLCQMISMLVVHHAFKIDVLKMEEAFHIAIGRGTKFFMFHLSIGKGMRIFKTTHVFFKSALDV
jgi:hypothetical protein